MEKGDAKQGESQVVVVLITKDYVTILWYNLHTLSVPLKQTADQTDTRLIVK